MAETFMSSCVTLTGTNSSSFRFVLFSGLVNSNSIMQMSNPIAEQEQFTYASNPSVQ